VPSLIDRSEPIDALAITLERSAGG
jgi:hypothetical protein